MWVAVCVLAGCGGKKTKEGAPGEPGVAGPAAKGSPDAVSGPGVAGIATCQAVVRVIDASIACAPSEDERKLAQRSTATIRSMHTDTSELDAELVPIYAERCVQMLDDLDSMLRWQKCKSPLSETERGWIEAHNARRTLVPPGASAKARDVLSWLAGVRDNTCRCPDPTCADRMLRPIDDSEALDMRLPETASAIERDAASDMLDEAMWCQRRLMRAVQFSGPPPESNPAEARRMLAEMEAAEAAAPKAPDIDMEMLRRAMEENDMVDPAAADPDDDDDDDEKRDAP